MKVPRKEFMKALSSLFPAMGKGEDNTSSNNYTFMNDEFGNSYIGVTNNAVAIVQALPFSMEHECRIPGTTLFNLVKKLNKAEELEFEFEADIVKIKTKIPTESTIQMYDRVNNMLDFITEIPDEEFKELPNNFTDGLKECAPYCLDDSSSSIIKYVYAHNGVMCSANKCEIVMFNLDGNVDKMFISAKDAKLISAFNLKAYAYKDSFLYFKTDTDAFIAIQPASQKERYPVVFDRDEYSVLEMTSGMQNFTPEALFSKEDMRKITITDEEAKNINSVIDTCTLFEEDNMVACHFDGEVLDLYMYNRRGSHKERVKLSNYVSPFTVRTMPKLLKDIVERKDLLYVGKGKIIVTNDRANHLIQIK